MGDPPQRLMTKNKSLSNQPRSVQSMDILYRRAVCSTWWSPVMQSARIGQAMRQPMRYAKATKALQLG